LKGCNPDFIVGDQPTARRDVAHKNVALPEHASYEQVAVTIARVSFAAHDRDAKLECARTKALDTRFEKRGVGSPVVKDVPILVVELIAGRAATESAAEEDVLDASFRQLAAQRIAIEMRAVSRPGLRSNVCYDLNPVVAEQGQESCRSLIRVADREDVEFTTVRLGVVLGGRVGQLVHVPTIAVVRVPTSQSDPLHSLTPRMWCRLLGPRQGQPTP
jgi:hypothetical protein